MPNYSLFDNPFDQFVNRDFSPAPTSPITPPFVDPTMYKLEDDQEYADLESQLRKVLAARRPQTKRGSIGNIIRAGLSSASAPNRAFGGPMDALSAFAGGMNLHRGGEIQDDQRFEQEQNRQARSLATMLGERRHRAEANARIASEEAQAAYHRARMNAPPELTDPYTYMTTSGGDLVKVNKRLGIETWLKNPNKVDNKTKAQEILEEATATQKVLTGLDAQLEAGEISENTHRALYKKYSNHDITGKITSDFLADRAEAIEVLTREGKDPTNEAINAYIDRKNLEAAKKKKKELAGIGGGAGAGRPAPKWQVENEAMDGVEAAFKSIYPDADRGNTEKSIKDYYARMLQWYNATPEVRERVPAKIRDTVISKLEAKATKQGKKAGALGLNISDFMKKDGNKPKTVKLRAPNGKETREFPAATPADMEVINKLIKKGAVKVQ